MVYTPPEGAELLRDKLVNWERYIHADDGVDPLIRLAITHYQFEAIHPFTYGNGRTGRVLNLLFLVEKDLLDIPVLYLSRYIIDNKKTHYDRLLAVTTDGAWEPWIYVHARRAIRETSTWSTAKIRAIRDLLDATTDQSGGICRKDLHPRTRRDHIRQSILTDRRSGRRWDRQAPIRFRLSQGPHVSRHSRRNRGRQGENLHESRPADAALRP